MQIQYKYFDGRYTHYRSTEVHKRANLSGHEVFVDTEGWFFVQDTSGNWQYFGTFREVKRFINNTYWEE